MNLEKYQKTEWSFVTADVETCFLVGSNSPELQVKAVGQELAPEVDYEGEAFNLQWE